MPLPLVQCTQCRAPVPELAANRPDPTPCAACGARLRVQVYPALFRPAPVGSAGDLLLTDSEASCFYHPEKKALLPCDGCGRFLCALCDCELRGRHYCPTCLEAGRTKGKIKNLENERTLYDNIALALAAVPLVVFFLVYFTFLTAPMALYVAIRYWNAPRSIVGRTRFRLVLAVLLALAQIAGWGLLVFFLFTGNLDG